MLSPINSLNYSNIKFNKLKQNKIQNKTQNFNQNPYQINSIYAKNINFRGYAPIHQKPTFEETLDYNYFQLPSITLTDGSKYRLKPDESQIQCAKALYDNKSVFFNAPTGTGKTAPMHYVINKNLQEGKQTYVLFPLKALTNDKCREFFSIYGEENIGILTGDIKKNTQAPVMLMTTEIYNNMTPYLQNADIQGTVIYDEAHYLDDFERGHIWEYSIINTPHDKLQSMLLSATVGNSEQVTSWIQSLNSQRQVQEIKVPKEDRYVPLVAYIYNSKARKIEDCFMPLDNGDVNLSQIEPNNLTSKQKRAMEVIYKHENDILGNILLNDEKYKEIARSFLAKNQGFDTFKLANFKKRLNELYPNLDKEKVEEIAQLLLDPSTKTLNKPNIAPQEDNYPRLVRELEAQNMLPAIIFRFSQNGCDEIVEELEYSSVDLTTQEEKEEIRKIIKSYQQKAYLGKDIDIEALLRGFGAHHAGYLPSYKKLIEELYSKKLIKVVAATTTLSAGINMPTKTVVLTDCTHPEYDAKSKKVKNVSLNVNELNQIIGRAGRRGIDNIGYYVLYNLSNKKSDSAPSELETTYNFLELPAKDLISHINPDWVLMSECFSQNKDSKSEIENLVAKSFSVFQAQDKDERKKALLARYKKYERVLIKNGFLKEEKNGATTLTPKGELLRLSSSVNPLVLASLVYDEKLKDVDIYDLCQIVGHLASSSEQKEEDFMHVLIGTKLKEVLFKDKNPQKTIKQFEENKKRIMKVEKGLLRSQKEQRINPFKIVQTDTFGGYVTYAFAILNDVNPYSVANFARITDTEIDKASFKKIGDSAYEYNRKIREGNVYDIIAKSYSILRRIEDICDYAISNPDKFPNQEYYEELKETAQLAQLALKQPPIYDETAI